jgi:uncharacterized coiled-coil protein SlyX
MNPHSRVWIYQSDKEFTAAQLKTVEELKHVFLQHWETHEKPVKGKMEILHNRFIVITTDEGEERICGGSIDASVRFMKELEQELNVSLLNRMLVAYKKDGKIISCTLPEFEALIRKGEVNRNTIVFNNTVHTVAEFENNWEVPVEKSWHRQLVI